MPMSLSISNWRFHTSCPFNIFKCCRSLNRRNEVQIYTYTILSIKDTNRFIIFDLFKCGAIKHVRELWHLHYNGRQSLCISQFKCIWYLESLFDFLFFVSCIKVLLNSIHKVVHIYIYIMYNLWYTQTISGVRFFIFFS